MAHQWNDMALLTVIAVLANHLGMVTAIEAIIHYRIPIVNCPKCLTFWLTLIYGSIAYGGGIRIMVIQLAVSFLCAYSATWLHLLLGLIDFLLNKVYDAIYPTESSTSDGAEHTDNAMPGLQEAVGGAVGAITGAGEESKKPKKETT